MHKNQHNPNVEAVRKFNRYYTRKIGVLNEGLVNSEYSLTEVRVLYELANRENPTAKEIAHALDLDAGYLSRILRKFEDAGLIKREVAEEDARQTILTLTKAGDKAFAVLRERSVQQVQDMLQSLSASEQHELTGAMRIIEALLDPGTDENDTEREPYILRTHQPGDIGYIVHRHGVLYAKEFQWDETFEALVAEIGAKFIREYDPRRERCWVAERNEKFLGTVMCVKGDDEISAKLRLLLVEPDARGMGVGKRLVKECIRFATAIGYKKLSLWTQSNLTPARKIYADAGFALIRTEPHHSFGRDLTGEFWELRLSE